MNRNNILKFRATDEEAAEIRRKAEAAGMSVSKFLRTSAIEGNVVLYDTSDLYGLRTDIKRIGNNINQIAMVVNSNRDVFKSDIEDVQNAFIEIMDIVQQHLAPLNYKVL